MSSSPYSLEEANSIKRRFRVILLVSALTIIVGTVAMMRLERLSLIDAVYFSVVSLTTVGYGDVVPVTSWGKIFVMFYLVAGIGIMAALINNVLRSAVARRIIIRSDKSIKEVESVISKTKSKS